MPSIHQLVFGGIRPAIQDKMLDPRNGVTANNAYLRDMSLRPYKAPRIVRLGGDQIRTIFKTPDGGGCCGKILTWDHCVSVMAAPNPGYCVDYNQLLVFHQCGHGDPERYFRCEDTFYPLIVPAPTRALGAALLTAGTLQFAPNTGPDQRAYTYTWVDKFGVESTPAPPSLTGKSYDDQTFRLFGFDLPPANAVYARIYRASSFFEDGSQIANPFNTSFQLVEEVDATGFATYDDTRTLLTMDTGTMLTADQCYPPPCMEQVVATESGYYVGWKDNQIYISEKLQPENFPEKYRMSIPDKIVGICAYYDTIFIGTTGQPYRFNVVFKAMGDEADIEAVPVPYQETLPLRSRFCLVPTNYGAMYTSTRGVVILPPQGPAKLDSRLRIGEEKWGDFTPNIAAYVNGKYVATRSPAGRGFIYDVQDPSEGQEPDLGDLTTMDFSAVMAMHTGHDGILYFAIGDTLFAWNDSDSYMTYTWRSKVFRTPGIMAFAAAKVVGAYGQSITFNLYCDGRLYFSRPVSNSKPFTLPARGKGVDWQFELIGDIQITEVHIATSVQELTEEAAS